MRTKIDIDQKLDQIMDRMNASPRLSADEKLNRQAQLQELKEQIAIDRDIALNLREVLDTTELYSQIDLHTGTIIRFRPRNSHT